MVFHLVIWHNWTAGLSPAKSGAIPRTTTVTDLVHFAVDEQVVAGRQRKLNVGILVGRILFRVVRVLGDEDLERRLRTAVRQTTAPQRPDHVLSVSGMRIYLFNDLL